jgi:hypothetical protein
MRSPIRGLAAALLFASAFAPHGASAFSQAYFATRLGDAIPLGHEWITRLAALELLGGDVLTPEDAADPRRSWPAQARATLIDLSRAQAELQRVRARHAKDSRFQPVYEAVLGAVLGERWVDIGGFNVAVGALPLHTDCFDAVAQEPAELQYDHYLRRWDDHGPDGAVRALQGSRRRFVERFVAAATAPPGRMKVWDGGATRNEAEVDRNYFLFGTSLHPLQDSFSLEHTVRGPEDHWRKLRQVKAYLCTAGSEQHTHAKPWAFEHYHGNRDAIWKPETALQHGWKSYKASSMTEAALVATEASKDAWAAFFRVMALPAAQRHDAAAHEAEAIAQAWLAFDEAEVRGWYATDARRDGTYVLDAGQSGKGGPAATCLKALGVKSGVMADKIDALRGQQRKCVFNVEPKDARRWPDRDSSLHIPYYWKWKGITFKSVPANWTIPAN